MSRTFSRTARTLLPALAALALAAPAIASVAPEGAPTRTSAGAAALAQERYYASYGAPATTPSDAAALAQEQYYRSYGTSTRAPATSPVATIKSTDHDGNALPFILIALGALIALVGGASGLQRVHARRRRTAGLAS
jgi:hypothetical protein